MFATRAVLAGVTLGIDRGQRVGVVGRNGDGKSTLFRVLAGMAEPDSGRVIRTAGARVVMVGQSDALPPGARTVRDVTVGNRPEHEWAADPRIRTVLSGLLGGVAAQGYAQGLDTGLAGLSGGERRRLALARALIDPGDVLLLDEPTNHLDIEAVTWLAGFLTGPTAPPTMAVVTHDRWFLDEVATTTWEVADRNGVPLRGRVRGVGPGPCGARAARGGGRVTATQPGEQGARVAAAWPAGAHLEAAVPHRRRERADRRRPRAARHAGPASSRLGPARPAGRRPRGGGAAGARRRRPGRGRERAHPDRGPDLAAGPG